MSCTAGGPAHPICVRRACSAASSSKSGCSRVHAKPHMSVPQVFQLEQVLKDAGLDKREDLHTSAADLDEDTRRSIVQLVGEVCGKMLRAARAEGGPGYNVLPTDQLHTCS